MNLTVRYVANTHAAQTWPLIEKYVLAAMENGFGDYTLDQIKLLVNVGQWVLMVAIDEEGVIHGAAASSFINYPNDRVAFITCTGGNMIICKDSYNQMVGIVKKFGATKVQTAVRESMSRLLGRVGFKNRYIVAEQRI